MASLVGLPAMAGLDDVFVHDVQVVECWYWCPLCSKVLTVSPAVRQVLPQMAVLDGLVVVGVRGGVVEDGRQILDDVDGGVTL